MAIERENPSLKGVLPKDFARPGLDKQALGQLIRLISDIAVATTRAKGKDMLGRVYEYFLAQFASGGGEEGRPVLYATARGPAARGDARAIQGPRVRPVLRLRRDVRESEQFVEAHGGNDRPTSASTGRSRTTRPGGWRR